MIGIIDYGSGNIFSVYNSLQYLGYDAEIISQPEELVRVDKIILPGVGAFGDAINYLQKSGFKSSLDEEVLHKGKPFLGICLGMQLIASTGFEKGCYNGLGWILGEVRLFQLEDNRLKVPHVGWNDINVIRKNPVVSADSKDRAFYFVHSYHFVPSNPMDAIAISEYGIEFVCAVMKDNIVGTQFHPEKSQKNGLVILENFANWRV